MQASRSAKLQAMAKQRVEKKHKLVYSSTRPDPSTFRTQSPPSDHEDQLESSNNNPNNAPPSPKENIIDIPGYASPTANTSNKRPNTCNEVPSPPAEDLDGEPAPHQPSIVPISAEEFHETSSKKKKTQAPSNNNRTRDNTPAPAPTCPRFATPPFLNKLNRDFDKMHPPQVRPDTPPSDVPAKVPFHDSHHPDFTRIQNFAMTFPSLISHQVPSHEFPVTLNPVDNKGSYNSNLFHKEDLTEEELNELIGKPGTTNNKDSYPATVVENILALQYETVVNFLQQQPFAYPEAKSDRKEFLKNLKMLSDTLITFRNPPYWLPANT